LILHVSPDCNCSGKKCSKCEQTQCIKAFHRFKHSADGRRACCKVCRKAERETEEFKAKRRERHKENVDHINDKKREWYHNNSEKACKHSQDFRKRHPETVKAYQQEYNRSEQAKERDQRYRERHPERVKQIQRNYWFGNHEHNLDQMRVHKAEVRTLLKGIEETFSVQEWQDLKVRYDYTCLACGRREPDIKLTVDHVQPVSRYGSNTISNIQPLCLSCNSRKGTKTIDYRIDQEEKNVG
jgi:5-methylcytosine-specific restriction endonuclease McrA